MESNKSAPNDEREGSFPEPEDRHKKRTPVVVRTTNERLLQGALHAILRTCELIGRHCSFMLSNTTRALTSLLRLADDGGWSVFSLTVFTVEHRT